MRLVAISDSGARYEFPSGAVRDMQTGKGRCDLLPPQAILRLAKHFEAGAVKYGERNWEKGIPINSFIDSGLRHILKYMAGQDDEDHLCAAAWNLMCAMETEEKFGWGFDQMPVADASDSLSTLTQQFLSGELTYGEMLRKRADLKFAKPEHDKLCSVIKGAEITD